MSLATDSHPVVALGRGSVAIRAWSVWLVGVTAYAGAVIARTSLSAVGTTTAERFHVTSSGLSLFSVLQLAVYAALQIPVGRLVDRFGPRRLIATGAVLIGIGQCILALAPTLEPAIAGRVLVGAGDAMTFVSVLRLVAAWFPPRWVAPVSQVTGILGGMGQLISVTPLTTLISSQGWTVAFLCLSGVGVGIGLLALIGLNNGAAAGRLDAPGIGPKDVQDILSTAVHDPGIRLGFWVHFSCPFAATVFSLLWGYPFLEAGEGLSAGSAATVFTVYIAAGLAAGPLIGVLTARISHHRVTMAVLIVLLQAATWTTVLLWPGRAPFPLLIALALVLAVGGPGSLIAFDLARTTAHASRLGGALGTVNVGGFIAALVGVYLVGIILNATGGSNTVTAPLSAFRAAFSVQYLLWGIGLAGIYQATRALRRPTPSETPQ